MGTASPRKLPPVEEIPDLGIAPDAEIARRFGASRERVRQIRLRAGVPALMPRPRLSKERIAEITRAAKAATSSRDAIRKAHCSLKTLMGLGLRPLRVGRLGAAILRVLTDEPRSLLWLAHEVGVPPSRALRTLMAMEQRGLVVVGDSGWRVKL